VFEEQYDIERERNSEQGPSAKEYIGWALIALGVLIALWVLLNAYRLFTDPQQLTRFQELVSGELETIGSSEAKEVKVVIPREILSYFVALMLLSIALGIASVFITAGVRLVEAGYQRFLRRVSTLEYKLSSKIDAIKDSLKNIDQ
jgi:hypothetical protein